MEKNIKSILTFILLLNIIGYIFIGFYSSVTSNLSNTHETIIDSLTNEVYKLKGQIDSLIPELSKLNKNIKELEDNNKNIKKDINNLQYMSNHNTNDIDYLLNTFSY